MVDFGLMFEACNEEILYSMNILYKVHVQTKYKIVYFTAINKNINVKISFDS